MKVAKKVLAMFISAILLLSSLSLSSFISVLANQSEDGYIYEELLSATFETDAEVKPNSGYYCGTSNAAAHTLDSAGYKYKNYDNLSSAANGQHLTIPVVKNGLGNNGSKGVIKLGYDGNASSNYQYRPVFSLRSSKSYNGRNVGQSFQTVVGETYKVSLYYKAETINTPVSLWMRVYNGSLTNAAVDSNSDSVELVKISSKTNGYVHIEGLITAPKKENLVIFMKAGDYSKVGGTVVYVDDVTVSLQKEAPQEDKEYEYESVLKTTFETASEVKANSGFYCGTSNAAAHTLDSAGYKYKNYDNISGAANGKHMTIPVVQSGIGNNSSDGVIKLGYDGNASGSSQYRPVFSLRCSKSYNGRNVGQSFQTVVGETYKVSFYYKAETINTPVSLWMRTYNGSLTNAAVDSNADSVEIVKISSKTNGFVRVEGLITATKKENLVIFMKAGDYSKVGGTVVYVDDVTVYLQKEVSQEPIDTDLLLATFENTDGKDAVYYEGNQKYNNGFAPLAFNNANIPNDPRLTCLVNESGIGNGGSNGAIRFGYQNNPNSKNKAGLPVFSVRSSETYNGRNDSQSFAFIEGETYILSFWYKAENINTPIGLYMREYDKSLSGARLDVNDTSRTVIKLADITSATDGYVKVETIFTAVAGQNMVFLMKPTEFSDLAGTTVYIDDISIKLPTDLPKVKFETNGGDDIRPRVVRPGFEFATLPIPVRDGFVFEGWFNEDYTVTYTEDTVCPENIEDATFYAKWSKISEQPKSFSTSFEESEYSVTPYYNDGVMQYNHNNITKSASWLKNAEVSYSGSGAMRITNDPFYFWHDKITHGFSLVNGDGTRFNVVEGQRYKIKFYYYATEPATAHSYISAIVSSDTLTKNAINTQQVVCKKSIHGIMDDWGEVEAEFEANVTGFVYITLTGRVSTSEASSRYHTTYVDKVSVELLDSEYVMVNYYDGTTLKTSSIGKKNDTLVHPILEVKTGYEFTGWYKDAECTERITDSVYPSQDVNYYAGYVSADYSNAKASNTTSIVMSFEENELMDVFYGTKQRLTKDLDDMGSEIELVKNDSENARTGKNYIKMSELEFHYSEIGLMLYDPNNENGNLYLEPGESYSVSYWMLPNDSFNVIQLSVALADVKNTKFAVKNVNKVDIKYIDPNDYEEGEWIKVKHTVTNNSENLRSVAIIAPAEGNNCLIDDISVNKMEDVTITFESNGGNAVEPMTIKTYSLIETVFEPIRDGFEFIGWCVDKELTKLFDYENTEVTGAMTLYAKWKADEVLVEENEEDEETSTDLLPDFVYDETSEDEGNGEKPIIDSADPVKYVSEKEQIVNESESVNLLVIIAIAGGAVLFIAGILVLILLLIRKRKKTIVGG